MSDPMNRLNEASHADKPKKASEPKKALPARNEAETSEKAQAGNLDMHKAQSHRELVHRAGRLSEAVLSSSCFVDS